MELILISQSQVTNTRAVSTLIKPTVWYKPAWNQYYDTHFNIWSTFPSFCVYCRNNFLKRRIVMMIDHSMKVHPTPFSKKNKM
jgi:hypothetical protein